MKCQRCNKEIKEGELFCNYCGAKVAKDNIEDTKTISRVDKKRFEDDSDIFYQPGLEKKSHSVNIFLIIIILALIGGIVYLLYFNEDQKDSEDITEEESYIEILYNDFVIETNSNMAYEYKDNKLFLTGNKLNGVIYTIEEEYRYIISNFDELTLKWNELGIKVDSFNELNSSIYEMVGSSDLGYFVIYLLNIDNTTLVLEFNFTSLSVFDEMEDEILKIVKSIKVSTSSAVNNFVYPEFNLEPFGSQ